MGQAARDGSPESAEAIARLCESCWRPVFSWIRRQGYTVDQAEDLTQAYFTRFLEKRFAAQFRPGASGCFRPFLLVSVRHFVSNERDRERARKRGGRRPPLSLDASREDGGPAREPADPHTPESQLENARRQRRLDDALARLAAEQVGLRRRERFLRLYAHLVDHPNAEPYRHIAVEWRVGESAVRVAVHRLRGRLREILEEGGAAPSASGPESRPGRRGRPCRREGPLRVAALVLAAVLGIGATGARAEEPDAPATGPRVRVTLAGSGDRVVGRLLSHDGDVLVLGKGRDLQKTVEIRRFDVARIEVSERRSRKAAGLGIGLLVGAGVAVAVGQAEGQDCSQQTGLFSNLCFSKSETSIMAGVLAVPIGAVVGWLVAPGERWRSDRLSNFAATVGPAPGGGFEARVALRF